MRYRHANFIVVQNLPEYLLIEDRGPWDKYPTITNDAEFVVEYAVKNLNLGSRRLFYIDSDLQTDELLVKDGEFAGFRTGGLA